MTNRAPWLGALLVLALAGAARAEVKDAAELLPAETLACVEVRQPERLSREVAALVKGSALEDMPATLARFRARQGDNDNWWVLSEVGTFGLFLSPEMIREGGRVRGGIIGLTGFSKENGPEYIAVVLPGDSNLPGLFMRGSLMFSNIRKVDEAEGVAIYRDRQRVYRAAPPAPPGGKPVPPRPEDTGPAMALLPGGPLVFGSTPGSVKDVIRRFKGKSADPALTGVSAFKEAARLRDRPGLFAYADVGALAAQLDQAAKTPGSVPWREWNLVKTAVNPEAFRSITASLTLENGNLQLQARLSLNDREKSPLTELLPDKTTAVELLHFVPRDALAGVALGLEGGARRWEKLLALADALAKGTGDAPSKVVAGAEGLMKLRIGKDVLGRLRGVALVLDAEQAGKKPRGPVLVLRADDAEAARFLEEQALPRLASLANKGEVPAPTRETVLGRRITSLAAELGPRQKALHSGRQGAVLVVGPDRRRVAEALVAGGKKEGLLTDEKVSVAFKELGEPVLVGVASTGQGLVEALRAVETQSQAGPAWKKMPATPAPGAGPAPAPRPGGKTEPATPRLPAGADKALKDLARTVEPLPPVVFGITRKADSLVLEVRQTSLRRVSARVIDIWLESALERATRGGGRFGIGGGSAPAAVEVEDAPVATPAPAPPPPPPPRPAGGKKSP